MSSCLESYNKVYLLQRFGWARTPCAALRCWRPRYQCCLLSSHPHRHSVGITAARGECSIPARHRRPSLSRSLHPPQHSGSQQWILLLLLFRAMRSVKLVFEWIEMELITLLAAVPAMSDNGHLPTHSASPTVGCDGWNIEMRLTGVLCASPSSDSHTRPW